MQTDLSRRRLKVGFAALVLGSVGVESAMAQTSESASGAGTQSAGLAEIVVTAQKRSQSVNSVGISITAANAETLMEHNVSSTADLAKLVPGFTAAPSPFNTPVYTLRGVGYYDSSLAAPPSVAVYTDEVALPFSAMTKAAALDVDHVEVLKGPQGTLFGQNTTGGAINYVAAKPSDHFAAGADASLGRFATTEVQGFLSGPLTSSLKARFAVRTVQSGPWQESFTRNDSLGVTNETQARLLLDWNPTDRLDVSINLNGWIDDSDSQAPQRWQAFISAPTASAARQAAVFAYPLVPANARAADWGTDLGKPHHDDNFFQAAVRVDYTLVDDVKLTSISAYERYSTNGFQDYDGTTLRTADIPSQGYIDTASQELRLIGSSERLNWVAGANFEDDKSLDYLTYRARDSTTTDQGPLSFDSTTEIVREHIDTASAFANVEYAIVPKFSVIGGLRYTDSRTRFIGCTNDTSQSLPGVPSVAPLFDFLQTLFRADGSFTPIPPDGCITLGPPPDYVTYPDQIHETLHEHNVAWRGSANYKTDDGLIFATVSKGYKAGAFPNTAASSAVQYNPVKQEELLAYELGFKQSLLDKTLQINGSLFYYDYKDKQLRGRIIDPIFGALDALVQIPKSRVEGAELEVVARPIEQLHLSAAATYLATRIQQFVGYDQSGRLANYEGSAFPYAPKWTAVADAQYDWRLPGGQSLFMGASLTYNSATSGSIGDLPQLAINSYALLDLRGGVASADGRWRASLWGRNVTNKYYWTNATQTQDGYLRYAGRPVTYGVTVSYRFN